MAPRRRPVWLAGLGLAALGLVLGGLALWQVSKARCFALTGPVVCHVATTRPLVALTFDDGPTPLGVEAVLPVLQQRGVRATFFLIGGEIERRPDLAVRLVRAGQEIGNHSYSHVRMMGRPSAFYDREIEQTEALLHRVGGGSNLFRPPYGKKLVGLPLSVQRHGLRMILWDVEDPTTTDPAAFARQVVSQARPGSIILLHTMYPANTTARRALPLILDGLAARGLQPVTVSALLRAGG